MVDISRVDSEEKCNNKPTDKIHLLRPKKKKNTQNDLNNTAQVDEEEREGEERRHDSQVECRVLNVKDE